MLIVTLTLLLDLIFGEPPVRFHAVVWMGDYLKFARSRWMANSPKTQLLEGSGIRVRDCTSYGYQSRIRISTQANTKLLKALPEVLHG